MRSYKAESLGLLHQDYSLGPHGQQPQVTVSEWLAQATALGWLQSFPSKNKNKKPPLLIPEVKPTVPGGDMEFLSLGVHSEPLLSLYLGPVSHRLFWQNDLKIETKWHKLWSISAIMSHTSGRELPNACPAKVSPWCRVKQTPDASLPRSAVGAIPGVSKSPWESKSWIHTF